MNCSLVDTLIDDYTDGELSPREQGRLEAHLASCPRCMDELRRRTALDHAVRQAIGAAVQHRYLAPAAGDRFHRAARDQLRRGIWLQRARSIGQLVGGLAMALLVLAGLVVMLDRLSLPAGLNPVTLLPAKHLIPSGRQMVEVSPEGPWDPEGLQPPVPGAGTRPGLTLSAGGSFVEPEPIVPGEAFTLTLLIHNNLPKTLRSAEFDLEISGPAGYFQFPLSVAGPLPASGISLVRISAASLAETCQAKYMLPPSAIFRLPGTYKVRITLFGPGAEPRQ